MPNVHQCSPLPASNAAKLLVSSRGEVCERLKQSVLKTDVPGRVPGVRIPPSPPSLFRVPSTALGISAAGSDARKSPQLENRCTRKGTGELGPSLRSGFRLAAQTPRKRLKFESLPLSSRNVEPPSTRTRCPFSAAWLRSAGQRPAGTTSAHPERPARPARRP